MKTFKDLQFGKNSYTDYSKYSQMFFDNGYAVAVFADRIFKGINNKYQISIFKGTGAHVDYAFDAGIDVANNFYTESEVTEIMKQIQELPKTNL